MNKKQSLISIIVISIFFFAVVLFCWLKPADDFSVSEKRKLASFPKFSVDSLLNGSFMQSFESYTTDQFPARELNRKNAAFFAYNILNKTDNHEIYLVNGSAAKLDYPLNEASVIHASERFEYVKNKFFPDSKRVFLSVIPDKGYFLSKDVGCPAIDYDKLTETINNKMSFAEYIDIFSTLNIDSFYRTDPHWNNIALFNTAEAIAGKMGRKLHNDYVIKDTDTEYCGTYAGQSALNMKYDTISYITNKAIDNASVFNHEAETECGIYDFEKLNGKDPYEFFLSGSVSLTEITNDQVNDNSKLIIFRDSFGSSIAPYFTEAYNKIILIDIRYIAPDYLDKFVDFNNADILYLYCTSVLNHSETLK